VLGRKIKLVVGWLVGSWKMTWVIVGILPNV